MNKWIRRGLFAAGFLTLLGAAAAYLYPRRYRIEEEYCKRADVSSFLPPCSIAEQFDRLCGIYAEAELVELEDKDAWIRAQIEATWPAGAMREIALPIEAKAKELRYSAYREAAKEDGATEWSCPPMER